MPEEPDAEPPEEETVEELEDEIEELTEDLKKLEHIKHKKKRAKHLLEKVRRIEDHLDVVVYGECLPFLQSMIYPLDFTNYIYMPEEGGNKWLKDKSSIGDAVKRQADWQKMGGIGGGKTYRTTTGAYIPQLGWETDVVTALGDACKTIKKDGKTPDELAAAERELIDAMDAEQDEDKLNALDTRLSRLRMYGDTKEDQFQAMLVEFLALPLVEMRPLFQKEKGATERVSDAGKFWRYYKDQLINDKEEEKKFIKKFNALQKSTGVDEKEEMTILSTVFLEHRQTVYAYAKDLARIGKNVGGAFQRADIFRKEYQTEEDRTRDGGVPNPTKQKDAQEGKSKAEADAAVFVKEAEELRKTGIGRDAMNFLDSTAMEGERDALVGADGIVGTLGGFGIELSEADMGELKNNKLEPIKKINRGLRGAGDYSALRDRDPKTKEDIERVLKRIIEIIQWNAHLKKVLKRFLEDFNQAIRNATTENHKLVIAYVEAFSDAKMKELKETHGVNQYKGARKVGRNFEFLNFSEEIEKKIYKDFVEINDILNKDSKKIKKLWEWMNKYAEDAIGHRNKVNQNFDKWYELFEEHYGKKVKIGSTDGFWRGFVWGTATFKRARLRARMRWMKQFHLKGTVYTEMTTLSEDTLSDVFKLYRDLRYFERCFRSFVAHVKLLSILDQEINDEDRLQVKWIKGEIGERRTEARHPAPIPHPPIDGDPDATIVDTGTEATAEDVLLGD